MKRIKFKHIVLGALSLVVLAACAWWIFLFVAFTIADRIPQTRDIALADLDGDGDLDAFLANGRHENVEANTVLLNDGAGRFYDSGQRLGRAESWGVVLRDFDADDDVDALISNFWGEFFWNDGTGVFTQSRQIELPTVDGFAVGRWRIYPADLNEDERFDLFFAGCCGGGISNGPDDWTPLNTYNSVWLSSGDRLPQDSGQKLGLGSSETVDLADLDGDSDLDVFAANSVYMDEEGKAVDYDPNRVWLNDGRGYFTDSGQRLSSHRSYTVALGDLDGDGDLDACVGNRGPDEIWLNDGHARFTDSSQTLDDALTRYLYLADLDRDGDLDAFAGDDRRGRIWLNNGQAVFTDSDQVLRYGRNHAVALGDIDGDGDEDVVAGEVDEVQVWFNDGTGRMH